MGGLCTVCERNYPLQGEICSPCKNDLWTENYNQEQDEDQDQVQDQVQASSLARFSVDPGPGCISGNDDSEPELRRLEALYMQDKKGELQPEFVELGPFPPHTGAIMRAIAEHMRFRMGLRRAVGDYRPLPYATREAVRAGIARDQGEASRAIGALVRAGTIRHVGTLPPLRPGIDGTKTYEPGGES